MIKNDISTSYLKDCILNGRDGEIIFSMDEKFQIGNVNRKLTTCDNRILTTLKKV